MLTRDPVQFPGVSTDLVEELVPGVDDRSPVPHADHLKLGGQLPHHADRVPEIQQLHV